jgi:glucose/arabinose dehydrogenase
MFCALGRLHLVSTPANDWRGMKQLSQSRFNGGKGEKPAGALWRRAGLGGVIKRWFALWSVALWCSVEVASAAPAPPANFAVEDVLTGIEQPMAIRFLPDGRMLVALKKGEIRIVTPQSSPIQSQVYINLATAPSGLDADQERGVLDLAVDPGFPASPYLYVFYTPATGPDGARARVARFTHVANSGGVTSRADASSELILWQDTQGYDSCCHFGGGLDFGPDGNLWLTVGDHFQGAYATDLQKSGGKVHRFTKTGAVPAGNPYADGAGPNVDTIFAYGLRNPFRSRWDLASGRFYISEVGGNTQSIAWEDLHMLRYDQPTGRFVDADFGTGSDNGVYNGINYGWPTVEGLPPHTDFPGFSISTVVGEPVFAYKHSNNFAAINGGLVYRGRQFPATYSNAYFYADSTRDFIRYLKLATNGAIIPNPSPAPIDYKNPDLISRPFDLTPLGRIVSLEVGPDGALYYASFTDSGGAYGEPNPLILGAVRRYVYDGGNARPVINQFTVTPASGLPPLTTTFTLRAADPENNAMTYVMDFGDGTPLTAAAPLPGNVTTNIPHVYVTTGPRTATVYVSDATKTANASVSLLVGAPPVVTSLTSSNSRPGSVTNMFRYGDTITFAARATDAEDGTLGGANFSWSISFIRPGNTHPAFGPVSGTNAIQFPIPNQGQGFSGPVYYRCFLTVTDSSGLSTVATADIFPEKSNIAFETVPSGLLVQVDGNTAQPTPFVLDSLINFNHVITVQPTNCVTNAQYRFDRWSTGSLSNQIVYNVPVTNSTLRATYVTNGACSPSGPGLITSGLVVQLESDLNVALQSGNIVAGWLDQSGLGNDMVASGTPRLGTVLTPSGKPAISLNGTTDKIERAGTLGGLPAGNANRTMFVVSKYNSSTAWAGAAYGNGSPNQAFGIVIQHPSGELTLQGWGGGNDLVSTIPGLGAGWIVQAGMVSGGNGTLFANGAQVAQFAHTYGTVLSKFVIGQEIASLGYVGMDAAAILVYNRALSGAERVQVETYLRNKFLNTPPVISITAPTNNTVRPFGSTVAFAASVNDDFDGGALAASLQWSSSLNGPIGSGPSFSVNALSVGTHLITAFVTDSGGRLGSTNVTVVVSGTNSTPPVITSLGSTNTRPGSVTNKFRFGDTVRFTAAATDAQDGPLTGANLSWSIVFVRNGVTYPVLGPVSGTNALNFPIPNQSQGFSGTVYYRCTLTATDSSASSTVASLDLLPEKANIAIETAPSGLPVQVDGGAATPAPFVLDALVNFNHVLTVQPSNCVANTRYRFDRWSTGALSNQIVYNVPVTNATLTALYVTNGLCAPLLTGLLTNGLVLRLESDTNVTLQTSNIVSRWLDRSGRSNDLTASGSPRRGVVLTPSGKPAITLNGTTAKLERTATLRGFPSGNADRTMFLAARYNSNSAWAGVAYGRSAANRAFGLVVNHPNGRLALQAWSGTNDLVSPTPGVGAGWLIQSGTVAGGQGTLYKDGAQIAQFAHAYNTTLNKLVIGQEIDGSGYAALDVAAVLVYDRALNATERAQVETYLRDKFLVASAGREDALSDAAGNLAPAVTITRPAVGALLGRGAGQELSAGAVGAGALGYQWFRNGLELSGATSSNLMLMNAQFSDAGTYAIGVSNAFGGASASVMLGVFELERDTDGGARFILAGPPGAIFQIECRDHLADPWQAVTNLTLGNSPLIWSDPGSRGTAQRYYRAILVP